MSKRAAERERAADTGAHEEEKGGTGETHQGGATAAGRDDLML